MNLADIPDSARQLGYSEYFSSLSDDAFRDMLADAITIQQEDRKQNQILFYQPASPKVQTVHACKAKIVGIGGGNGSSKTESMLVDMVMSMTGVFPYSQRHLIEQKFRGPINCRLVVESLTTTLEPIILPKLQWYCWTGVDQPGGTRGHWGWIPKSCLIDGEWSKSYSVKNRMLSLLCRDPYNLDKILGESKWQFMSVDMDPTDFASGDFHIIGHDEPPRLAQWRENEARTMRVDGRMLLAMTWPDDPSINVDWLYNEVYEVGRSGSDPNVAWFELWTTENQNLKQEAVATQAAKWSPEITNVRIFGRPIRFSNRIHPEFTDNTKTWCFKCDKSIFPVPSELTNDPSCPNCGAETLAEFNHVQFFETAHAWPTIYLIDPHPRKPHMYLWVQISPSDDWYVVAEGKCEGDCTDVARAVLECEEVFGLRIAQRLMDPNMGASVSGQRRDISWQNEFAAAKLVCDLAQDVDMGRARVNHMLKPDPRTRAPRLLVHPRCRDTIYHMNRYSWAEFSKNVERDLKQQPKDMYSDYPTLLKYLANSDPVFRFLKDGAPVVQRAAPRKAAYG